MTIYEVIEARMTPTRHAIERRDEAAEALVEALEDLAQLGHSSAALMRDNVLRTLDTLDGNSPSLADALLVILLRA